MPHVVTQPCCADASCAFACPVNAIHPTPDEPDFATADMVYIDPATCVDCGACVGACPVRAIKPDTKLAEHELPFVEINAAFHVGRPAPPIQAPVPPVVPKRTTAPLRVAVVGAGPAGLYAADELLKRPGVEVTVVDRLPTPYGLVRAGVAPDHPETRAIDRLFRQVEEQPGFSYLLGVEVGTDVTHAELAGRFDAVLYSTGAPFDRALDVPGGDTTATATDVVAWYNGHPDRSTPEWRDAFDLTHERAVVVGNGNVALDVARILATDPALLESSDVADHALAALRASAVREVVVLARRGPAQSAFTLPEITGLVGREDIEVVVEGDLDGLTDPKAEILRAAPRRPGARRVVLRYLGAPVLVHETGVDVARTELVDDGARAVLTDAVTTIEAGLVLRAVGYRGRPVADLPFDAASGTVPHDHGSVDGMPGTYVAGWIKRGPSGFIGTNKTDATETVDQLFADLNAGLLPTPTEHGTLADLLRARGVTPVDLAGWRRIDVHERLRGLEQGRPRVRLTDVDEMRATAAVSAPVRRRRPRARRVAWGA